MHKILVIRLYFPLDALHVSDYISPEKLLQAVHRIWHIPNAMYILQKVAPKDGLIQSETCRASNGK